ncbi:ethanolamine ammonia-lyase subunit EutC [Tardiphaga alba]|uniref:Ethanolamine ammonia-lyase small subunit n=1 Tax=Tardiphaga alba TaxID=340268 RepID=A0ABX8AFF5_9BRAD|nr:ethanolamine ammonia-lyase subunit EutC [Tardiphaga alba]QUS42496.1 ethanolamine ammonia-lyase subunit EutC [Tardiphaga alba]
MTSPSIGGLADLRRLTPARVGLGRAGASLRTQALLDFTLDHARARDAVHAPFEAAAIAAALNALGRSAVVVSSLVADRADYLKRPDLGRKLAAESRSALDRVGENCDVALVIADGLSPAAVNAHAISLVAALLPRLDGLTVGPPVVATGARVALGDEIGALLNARMTIMVIGERPGLSAPQSLGAYLTVAPQPGRSDAERNCVSNIQVAGLGFDEAAIKIAWLAREGLRRGVTGIALKDESGLQLAGPANAD